MAVNLSALSTATTTATTLSNLILITPGTGPNYQPQPNPLVNHTDPTFVFDYEGENSVSLESDITDHYVEDNSAINDQIALKPEMVTVHGYIGELNDIAPALLKPLKTIADKLAVLSAYTPQLSITAQLIYNEAFQLYQTASLALASAVSVWNAVGGGGNPAQNKQQVAFQKLYGYYRNRTLFTVQTPWCTFKNMAIKSIRAVQDETTNVVTDFEITFKIMRFAQASTTDLALTFQGRLQNQASLGVNTGSSTGTTAPFSLGSQTSMITGVA